MKNLKLIAVIALVVPLAALLVACSAKNEEIQVTTNAKPYPLNTCLVCGMKLGEMGEPYSFVYEGQEIKVCDKSEKASFDKDPAKYMKKLADAEAGATKPDEN